jgi:hypothetical protein
MSLSNTTVQQNLNGAIILYSFPICIKFHEDLFWCSGFVIFVETKEQTDKLRNLLEAWQICKCIQQDKLGNMCII